MRRSEFKLAGRRRARAAAFVLLAFATASAADAAVQSGRRVRETPKVEPVPIITPKIETAPANRRSLPDIPIAVAGRVGARVTRGSAEVIYNNFASRLGEFMKVTSLGLAKREEAIRRAREGGRQFVVFVEFEFEPLRDGGIVFSSPDIVVNYSVVDATNGKSKMKGRIYYRPGGGPADEPIKITREAAGEEAAERVLDWFALPTNVAK